MPVHRTLPRLRLALVPAILLSAAWVLTSSAQPPDSSKKPADAKGEPKTAPAPRELPGIRLPDGTYLWYGHGEGDERINLTPQEYQKLLDQLDQLKKQLAARKTVAPSGCAIRARVEKRGDQLVAAIKLTLSFRTTAAQTAVALGGKKGFLVSGEFDGGKLPVLESGDDGFAAMIESAGDHTLALDLEAPVTARGAKPELGFEIGLPRAAITTLLLEPPEKDVKRVNLAMRATEASPLRPPEPRRVSALDVAQLAARPGHENGYALGPVELVEVAWEPTASAAQPADRVQSAEVDVAVLFTESVVETTAKFRLRGPATAWKLVAPADAALSADRAPGATDAGPAQAPLISRPGASDALTWTISFPAGSPSSDWIVTAVTRQARPQPQDPKHRGPFAVGPFTALNVLRQTGTVRVTAGPHTRFVFKHGPDLRREALTGAIDDEVTSAFFRLTSGPTGAAPVVAPLFTIEAWRLPGRVAVKPTYNLSLTEAGWKVRAELKVSPIGTEIDALTVEVPARWRGLEASPAELVEGVQPAEGGDGFWQALVRDAGGEVRSPVLVKFSAGHKQPFDLILTATTPVLSGAAEGEVSLPRFPGAVERDSTVTATVPEGLEVRGEARVWEGDRAANWGSAIPAAPSTGSKASKAVTAITGRTDGGFARVDLAWHSYRPDLAVDLRADVTLFDRQLVVQQVARLRSPDGLPRSIRFHGPSAAAGLRVQSTQLALEPLGPGEWKLNVPGDARELTLNVNFAIPLAPRAADDRAPWRVPVGFLWPVSATRSDATVRVWSSTVRIHSLANVSSGWRELPLEPAPDREALPVLVLAASTAETPLVLEATEVEAATAVAVWIDRGLVQAWSGDDGPTRYRARFVLRRWLTPAVEIRMPGPADGATPEFYRDGQRVEAVRVVDGTDGRAYRIPLPEARPGRTTQVEVRYQLRAGDSDYHPPLLPAAAFAGPVRWQVAVPPGSVPLLREGGTPEIRWGFRNGLLAPGSVGSPEELDAWLRTGEEPRHVEDANGETVSARQSTPATLSVGRAPRIGFTIAASAAFFVLFLILTRLPLSTIGAAAALIAGAIGLLAVYWPQPVARAAAASQPGLLAAVVVVLAQFAARSYYRHRITHLPGFARAAPDPTPTPMPTAGPSTSRNRPVAVGSSSAAPTVPAGG
jgi:hypothetical protein